MCLTFRGEFVVATDIEGGSLASLGRPPCIRGRTMHRVDKPQPIIAGLVWTAFLVVILVFEEHDVLAALGDAVAYSLIGAAFGLSAHSAGRWLLDRVPTERQVAEGRSLRLFRLRASGLHLLIVVALGFAAWRLGEGSDTGIGNDAPIMTIIGFITVQQALGWSWSKLGMKAVPDRPDPARV